MTDTEPRTPAGVEPVEPAQGYDVFVSYSRADRDRVVTLVEGLEARGVRTWVDLEAIPPSAEWMAEIRAAIEGANGYLVVVSPDLARSSVCAEELEHAIEAGKRIVPVLVSATDPGSVPQSLAARNWIDATGGADEALDPIVEALRTDLDHVKAHTRLGVLATEWERKGEPKALLLRGAEIAQAEGVVASADEPRATPTQARFVQASRAGANRRQRGWIGAVAAALVVALGLSAVALVQRGEAIENQQLAESQTQIANSRALSSEALLNMDERLDVGMLLALEAYRTAPTPQAIDAMHIAAQRSAWMEQTFRDHDEGGINALARAPSGEVLAEAGADGTVILRDGSDGAVIGEPLAADSDSVFAIAFDPTSTMLATGGIDGKVIVWDVGSMEGSASFEVPGHEVTSLTFADDGDVLVAGTSKGEVVRWDLGTGEPIGKPVKMSDRTVSALAVDPNSGALIVGTERGDLVFLDVRTGDEIRSLAADAEEVWALAIDPDARLLAVGALARRTQAATGEILLFDLRTGRPVREFEGHSDVVYAVAFSPDGDSIASGSADGTVRTWDVASGQPVGAPLRGHSDWVNGVAYAADGRSLFSGSTDGTVIEWDIGHRLFGLGGPVGEVLFAADGSTMVSTEAILYEADGSVSPGGLVLWDTTTLEPSATRTDAGAYGIANTPDGAQIVGTEVDTKTVQGRVVYLDSATLNRAGAIDGPGDFLTSVGVGPEGTPIVAAGGSGDVYVWNSPESKAVTRGGHESFSSTVRYSPDRTMLATGATDGTVVLRDPETGEPEGEPLLTEQGGVYAVAFDADSERLAVGDFKGRVTIWDPRTRELLLDLDLEDGAQSVAFSPDGAVLAVGTTAGEVQLFEASTGTRIGGPIAGQRDWVNSVSFSPGGDLLASASEDGSILLLEPVLWSDDIELLTERLCLAAGRSLTEEEWTDLVGFAPYNATCPDQI